MKKWLIICIFYLILILADGGLTFFNTPSLSMEANPLVLFAGFGWGILIVANSVVFFLFCALSYYPLVRYKSVKVKADNMAEYFSKLLFGQYEKLTKCFTKTPKNKKPVFAAAFYAVTYALLIARSVIVLEWLLITLKINLNAYGKIRNGFPLQRLDVSIFLPAYLFFIFFWFIKEHKCSQIT